MSEPDTTGESSRTPPAKLGDVLLDRLETWRVRRRFGYPGDGINGIMGTLAAGDPAAEDALVQWQRQEITQRPA